eukprot:maker-scaffold_68-snap-gene-0.98-mRNA-1 protein AED:0.00 eAED:0.00 QI:364/0.83/0.85/1/0.5/0.28/7/252/480
MSRELTHNLIYNLYKKDFSGKHSSWNPADSCATANERHLLQQLRKLKLCPQGVDIPKSSCNMDFFTSEKKLRLIVNTGISDLYIWDVDHSKEPVDTCCAHFPFTIAKFCPNNEMIVASGHLSGGVLMHDIRQHRKKSYLGSITGYSDLRSSHRGEVTDLIWLREDADSSFLSSSLDGKLMIWDSRALTKPKQTIQTNPLSQKSKCVAGSNGFRCMISMGCTNQEKFLIGSESGDVFSLELESSHKDIKKSGANLVKLAASDFSAYRLDKRHGSTVTRLSRNRLVPHLALSSSNESVKLWNYSENNCIRTIEFDRNNCWLLGAAWSPTKHSVFFNFSNKKMENGLVEGRMAVLDLLFANKSMLADAVATECVSSQKVSSAPLTSFEVHSSGKIVAVSDTSGEITILQTPPSLNKFSPSQEEALRNLFYRDSMISSQIQTESEGKLVDQNYNRPTEKLEPTTKNQTKQELDILREVEEKFIS